MPLYEYRCTKCKHEFEQIMGMKDPNPPCTHKSENTEEHCGGETERLISRSSFTLKGGGWYSDGYGK